MKKQVKILSLLVLVVMLIIVVISCGTGVKFNNLIGGSGGSGGNGISGGNQGFALLFDGQYQNDLESFSSIVPTSDGGYFIVGLARDYTQSPAIDDALFVKLNQNLQVQWSKLGSIGVRGVFGFENIENGNAYYYACGYANNNGFFITKLNDDGSTNKIIYFSDYVNFMLPHNTGIIASMGIGTDVGIAKFDYDLNNLWYITNMTWGYANTITSDNKTVAYYIISDSDGFLVKFDVSHNSFSGIQNDGQTKYAYISNNINSNNLEFLGSIKDDSDNFYFGFVNYGTSPDTYYLIKTNSDLEKLKEISFSGERVSLVPVPNSTNLILAVYKDNEGLILVKLDSELNTISNPVKINNFYPPYYVPIMRFTPLINHFLVSGTYNSNGLIYTFDYNLNPPCGNTSTGNLTLQNTSNFNIYTTPSSTPTLQSGSITVTPANTATTDYPLNRIDACPIN